MPLWGFECFCYGAPKICTDFRGGAKKQPVPWHVGLVRMGPLNITNITCLWEPSDHFLYIDLPKKKFTVRSYRNFNSELLFFNILLQGPKTGLDAQLNHNNELFLEVYLYKES